MCAALGEQKTFINLNCQPNHLISLFNVLIAGLLLCRSRPEFAGRPILFPLLIWKGWLQEEVLKKIFFFVVLQNLTTFHDTTEKNEVAKNHLVSFSRDDKIRTCDP